MCAAGRSYDSFNVGLFQNLSCVSSYRDFGHGDVDGNSDAYSRDDTMKEVET